MTFNKTAGRVSYYIAFTSVIILYFLFVSHVFSQYQSIYSSPLSVDSQTRKTQFEHTTPKIVFEESTYDFGEREQGQKLSHSFKFTNLGNKLLEIIRVLPSCGCISTALSQNKLALGESGELKAIFDTASRLGPQHYSIIVSSNDPDNPLIYLNITGNVIPPIQITPSLLYLGDMFPQETITKELRITFPEKRGLEFDKFISSSTCISGEVKVIDKSNAVLTIKVGSGLTLGGLNEKVTLLFKENTTERNIKVPITGNIINPIIPFPTLFFFGMITTEDTLTQKVQLTSIKNTKFTITKIESKLDPFIAKFKNINIKTIKEHESYELRLTIIPKIKKGLINGKVLVYTDNPIQSKIEISIIGYVQEQELALNPNKTIKTTIKPVKLFFFYSTNCPECPEIKNEYLPKMKEKYGNLITIKSYDIENIKNYELLVQYENKYKNSDNVSMKLFIGNKCLAGKAVILKELEPLIQKQLNVPKSNALLVVDRYKVPLVQKQLRVSKPIAATGTSTSQIIVGETASRLTTGGTSLIPPSIIDRFQGFNIFLIAGAGLLDGINPCAFTTIIFFISLLALVGKTKPELLTVGIFFTLAVFVTYLLLGLGTLQVLSSLRTIPLVRQILRFGVAGVAFVFAILSGYDIIVYLRTKKTNSMTMQFPTGIKERIHQVMRDKLKMKGLIFAAFTTGILVSLLESVCTGQVYLPTLVFMTKESTLKFQAYGYLLLYNLMFIIPLVIVFLLALFGVTSTRFASLTRRNLVISKSLLVLLFLILGSILMFTG